jgi:tetratricopeptide (TPR) repeat protein/predicted Ser/Thr protein kinase
MDTSDPKETSPLSDARDRVLFEAARRQLRRSDSDKGSASTPEETGGEATADATWLAELRHDSEVISLPEKIGDYEIQATLGRGGMGVVYRARQKSVDRVVALKVIRPEALGGFAPEQRRAAVSRFVTEAQAAARLEHEAIVTIYEVGEADGRPFYSMQHVDGGSLRDRVEEGPLEARRCAALMQSVARAVHEAHQHGILHRDLKPHNILIDIESDLPLVTDFGLAKMLEGGQEITRTGEVFGSPPYMSPEQAIDASNVTIASDVYALGATLYHLLTGRPPFQGTSPESTIHQVINEQPMAPSQVNPKLHRDLETICLKCLEKQPAHRYQTAAEFADELDRFLHGRPIEARPVGRLGRTWRWAKRNPRTAVLASALLILVGFALGTFLQLRSVSDQRDRALTAEARATTAEQQRQELLAHTYADTGTLAMQRGQMLQAITYFDQALSEGHNDEIAVRLKKVEAWVAMTETDKAIAEIKELAQLQDLGNYQGQVLLWQAQFAVELQSLDEDAESLLRQAIGYELPRADRAYAESLLADTSPEAVERLRRSLEFDPFHHRSHKALVMILISLGRLDEAQRHCSSGRILFPDDPNFALLEGLIWAWKGESSRAESSLAEAKVSVDQQESWKRTFEFLDAASGKLGALAPQATALNLLNEFWEVVQKIQALQSVQNAAYFPPAVSRRLRDVFSSLKGHGFGVLNFSVNLGFGNLKSLQKAVSEAVEVHPEGTLFMLQGHLFAIERNWNEAIDAYQRALNTPAVFRSVPRETSIALANVATVQALLGEEGEARKATLQIAVSAIRNVSIQEPVPEHVYYFFVPALVEHGDYELARQWLREWEAHPGLDENRQRKWRAKLEFQTGNFTGALDATDQFLMGKIDPKRPNDLVEVREIREKAIAEITKCLEP